MKSHDRFIAFAAMAIDGPLSSSEQAQLEQHLGGCAACARDVARLRQDARELARLAVPPLPARRSAEILTAAMHPGLDLHPVRLLAIAALLGLLFVGSLGVGSQLLRRDDDLSVVPPVPTVSPTPSTATASPRPSPGFVLRAGPATSGCDAIGLEYRSLTFRIDPTAADPVTARTDTGGTLRTYWAPGFTAGSAQERVIRDPAGAVVVRDGDVLRVGDRLHDSWVCLGPETLYVFTQAPQ